MSSNNPETLQHKIQSLEHSLIFLQEQHTSTLEGLHEEINKLQQKCTSLINQLAQSGLYAENGEEKTESSLEETLKECHTERTKLIETLEMKDERIRMMELQLKSKEQKYQSDMKHYQLKAAELQTELEHKSASIAYLTAKLQQSQVKDTILSNEAVTSGSVLVPSPPKGIPNRQHERKNIRCVVSSPAANVTGFVLESSSIQTTSSYVLQNPLVKNSSGRLPARHKHSINDPARPAVGHSQNRRDHDMILFSKPRPTDYEDFIKINQSEETITKQVIEPLPPIASGSGKQLRRTRSKTFSNKNPRSNSSGEVETVIVEPGLSSPDRPCRTVQDLS